MTCGEREDEARGKSWRTAEDAMRSEGHNTAKMSGQNGKKDKNVVLVAKRISRPSRDQEMSDAKSALAHRCPHRRHVDPRGGDVAVRFEVERGRNRVPNDLLGKVNRYFLDAVGHHP